MIEVWKDIEWYEWLYKINNLWIIKSLSKYINAWSTTTLYYTKEKLLKYTFDNDWYLIVWLCNNKKRKTLKVQRLVWMHFIPNPDNKPCINHKFWIKDDNRASQLEWNTYKENTWHMYSVLWIQWSHTWKFWIDNPNSKKVNQYDLSNWFIKVWNSLTEAANELWLHHSKISNVCKGKRKTTGWFIWKYN